MKKELIYVELTNGFNHDEKAEIGFGYYNRTRSTVYFNGRIFGKGKRIVGNFVDIETGENYWVSGTKKNGQNRHWAGKGKIHIDKTAIPEYLNHINQTSLPKNQFVIDEFDNEPRVLQANQIENAKKLK